MSREDFNPYYKWLGIPAEEQPPHHYRLLGIRTFEEDLEVIEYAADRIMAHLRTFQAGQHSAHSQRLLNEVSGARVCLLEPVRKAAYDAQLRQRLEGAAGGFPTEPVPSAPPPTSPPTALERITEDAWTAPSVAARGRVGGFKKRQGNPVLVVAIVGALAMLVGAAGVVLWGPGSRRVAQTSASEAGLPRRAFSGAKPPAEKHDSPSQNAGPLRSEEFFKSRRSPSTEKRPAAEKVEPKPVGRKKAAPPADLPEAPAPQNEPVDEPRVEMPVAEPGPLPAELDPAIGAIMPVDTRPGPKGASVALPDPPATTLRRPDDALAATRPDGPDENERQLLELAQRANDAVAIQALVEAAGTAIREALDAGRVDAAVRMAEAVEATTEKPAGVKSRREADQLKGRALLTRTRYSAAEKAKATLKTNPSDPDANSALGLWNWLVKEDWEAARPLLEQGDEASLRDLARREQSAATGAPERQMALAEAWLSWAQSQTGDERVAGLKRAEIWYRSILKTPDSAALRVRVEKRLAIISAELLRSSP